MLLKTYLRFMPQVSSGLATSVDVYMYSQRGSGNLLGGPTVNQMQLKSFWDLCPKFHLDWPPQWMCTHRVKDDLVNYWVILQ